MEWLNRIALVVTPKRRFFDWVNGLPEAGPPLKTEEAASHRMLYLAATGDAMPPLNELIDTYWEEIFDEALGEWILDESLWPVNRTAHVFRDWFHVESIDGVADMDPGEPVTIRELARTRCASCDADLGNDAIVVCTFTDRRARRMSVQEVHAILDEDAPDGHSDRPLIVLRCCSEECARRMEAALEQAGGADEHGADEEVR
jgi:hypothetical protein